MPIICSGAAVGADMTFGECASRVGHEVRHYVFPEMLTVIHPDILTESLVVLERSDLLIADRFLERANQTLKRSFPSRHEYVNNLLRRNYWQVRDTKAIFAVANLESREITGQIVRPTIPKRIYKVQGGTAWAIQMAIDLRVPTIYVFDLLKNQWNQWYYSIGGFEYILPIDMQKPEHFSIYTGIGSRTITPEGKQAIQELYK